jgi:thiamine-monophosphate kinase
MDLSDGLVADLGKLCRASGLAARVHVDRVPVQPAALRAFGEGSLAMALGGGEDYELLFTAPSGVLSGVLDRLPSGGALIGEITDGPAGQVTVVDEAGRPLDVGTGGWDHFAP